MRTGKTPEGWEPIELPDCVFYIWEWFQEVVDGRNYAGMGQPLPISWAEIKAWSELTGTEPTTWEIQALKMIDRVYLIEASKKK